MADWAMAVGCMSVVLGVTAIHPQNVSDEMTILLADIGPIYTATAGYKSVAIAAISCMSSSLVLRRNMPKH